MNVVQTVNGELIWETFFSQLLYVYICVWVFFVGVYACVCVFVCMRVCAWCICVICVWCGVVSVCL